MNLFAYIGSTMAILCGAQCVTMTAALAYYTLAIVVQLWRIAETIKEKRP